MCIAGARDRKRWQVRPFHHSARVLRRVRVLPANAYVKINRTGGRPMDQELLGIHHITAIAGEPQENIDFYAGVLGLRLVKLTINFDDPGTYYLYYGDGVGHPGT